MKITTFSLFFIFSSIIRGQEIDTLSFYSKAFEKERTVLIHKPEFYKYKSDSVKFPVIYLLDGQHEWFVNPLLSDIQYLQYTHEIPNAIIVVIPLENRNDECGIVDLKTQLPLDKFITEELDQEISAYNPSDYRIIIGHSFSASFSLYSYYNHPEYYAAVIANTPLDKMQLMVKSFQEHSTIEKGRISISVGSIEGGKDYHHRKGHNQLKERYPAFYNSINFFEADYSAHNAVPILATPAFLTRIFESFSDRYSHIAKVNDEYKLVNIPEKAELEIKKIILASRLDKYFYPPEIAEINGIASRYWNSEYYDMAIEVYLLGIKHYPNYYEFYLSLYGLSGDKDQNKAKKYLKKAELLLTTVEDNWEGKGEIIEEIRVEKTKNGW